LTMVNEGDVDDAGFPDVFFRVDDLSTNYHRHAVASFYFAFSSHCTGNVPYHQIGLFFFHIRCDSTSVRLYPTRAQVSLAFNPLQTVVQPIYRVNLLAYFAEFQTVVQRGTSST
jgi:hypothetical protein